MRGGHRGLGGGFEFGQKELQALWGKGGKYVSAYQSFAWFYPVNSGQISIRHGLRGPGSAIVSEQAGGLDAIAKARRHVRSGTPLMVTGGVDGSLSPWSWLCIIRSGRLSLSRDPRSAYVPFDRRAQGSVVGEGGALLILEDAAQARERGAAHRYGEVAGYASTFDPRPGSGREPGLRRAIELALSDASMAPDDIDVVFADACGVPELDRIEAEALAAVFGPRGVAVTAPKTMTGRLLAGGASLDVATALLAIRDKVIPPPSTSMPPLMGSCSTWSVTSRARKALQRAGCRPRPGRFQLRPGRTPGHLRPAPPGLGTTRGPPATGSLTRAAFLPP